MRSFLAAAVFAAWLLGAGDAAAVQVSIGNFVWHDVNGNGVQDPGEPGLAGVGVQLLTADRKQLLDETTTNGSGSYSLVGEAPGAFRVRVLAPEGFEITRADQGADDQKDSDVHPFGADARDTDPIAIAPNVISTVSTDVGLTQPSGSRNVGDFVWHDLDGNGLQDGGEPGVAGVTVELWNARKTERLAATTTSLLGVYSLTAQTPSLVRIRVIPPPGMEPTRPGAGTGSTGSDIAASGADLGFSEPFFLSDSPLPVATLDAGLLQPANPVSIGDRVWRDDDVDGIQDPGEPGIAGVTVQLWNAARTQLLDTAVTNGSGNYTLAGEAPRGFQIRVVAPDGYQHTRSNVGLDDSVDSDVEWRTPDAGWSGAFFVNANTGAVTGRDAGLVLPGDDAVLGDQVWLDLDYDGIREGGESSVQGVTVELWNAPKTRRLATTTTNASGLYSLLAPRPGLYRLRVPLAASSGVAFTQALQGADPSSDSDVNPFGDDFSFSDPIVVAASLVSANGYDVGLLPQAVPEPGGLGGLAALLALVGSAALRRHALARA